MHTLLIVTHIGMMVASLLAMAGALSLGFFGKSVAVRFASIGFYASIVGFVSGGALLFGSILSFECALLTAYLLATTILYHVGFGFGDAKYARFVRATE